MAKAAMPLTERRMCAVAAYVPMRTRTAVERIARRAQVPIAEVARRALEAYVAAEAAQRGGKQRDE